MKTAKGALALSLGVSALALAEPVKPPAGSNISPVPLHAIRSTTFTEQNFVWAGPALCDADENTYFLVVPHMPARADAAAGDARDVLRVSADGKKRTTFSPASVPRFVGAVELKTLAVALGPDGNVFLVVWARREETRTQADKKGQFIVSFSDRGEYQSAMEVEWEEILIQQFEVFGSGAFLLRGRLAHKAETRVAVLSPSRGSLQDVAGWSYEPQQETGLAANPEFDHMVRGHDGRIYVTTHDSARSRLVYAISASGEEERMFALPPPPWKDAQFIGWKAGAGQFASIYHRRSSTARDESTDSGRWWIAVHTPVAEADPQTTVYGPAPGPPLCYARTGSTDRFTFLAEGPKVVTMSSR